MTKRIYLAMVLCAVGMLQSCQYNWVEYEKVDPNVPVSFGVQVEPIFTSRGCVSCHNSGLAFSLKTDEAYPSIVDNSLFDLESPELSILLVTTHASSEYTSLDKDLILNWIKQGALDN